MADVSDERITHAMFSSAPFDFSHEEIFAMLTELQARRAAEAGMREALNVATNAIQWMSAASDFAPEGKAHEGWKSIRRDMEKIAAALGARAVEVDLPNYLRFGEPDMFPPAQK